jgi:hypothetical protein
MSYDPTIGRFISEDPIAFEGGDANLYRYTGNSPTNATDPTGLFELPPPQGYDGLGHTPPSPDLLWVLSLVKGNPQLAKELILILKKADESWVVPNTPVLSYFIPEVFGSHCMRWGENFFSKIAECG